MKKKINDLSKAKFVTVILLVITSLGSVFWLLLPGFYEPQDLHHIADIYQMYRAIMSGQIPPRWGPDFLNSYGYPLFNFYYPGPFYLGAFFYFVSGNLRTSYELVFVTGVLVGTIGLYLFLRNHFSKIASTAAAVLFTYTPYKAVQIYVRGAMGEFLSLSLMPFFLYVSEKYNVEGKRKWFFLSVIISSLVILSHNYFWLLIFGFSGIYFAIGSFLNKNARLLRNFLVEVIFAFGITAYWWLPAFLEQRLLYVQTPFPLIDHFPFIKQLIIPSWGYGASLWGPMDGMSFQLGIVNILVIISAFIVFIAVKQKKHNSLFIWSGGAIILCLYFMNIRSYSIWKMVPFYNLFQFPWRLLAFTGIFSSILAAFLIDTLGTRTKKAVFGKLAALIIIAASISMTVGYFKPSRIFYKNDNDYLNRMFANRTTKGYKSEASKEYLNWSEDYLLLPYGMEKKPDRLPTAKFASVGDGITVKGIREISPVSWEADIDVEDSGKLNFYVLNFPGWVVYVNRIRADLSSGESGQVVFNVHEGATEIKAYWTETGSRKVADAISLFSIILLIIFPIKSALPENK